MLTLTDAASAKLAEIMSKQTEPMAGLRVSVQKGGCSGFSYGMTLAPTVDALASDYDGRITVAKMNVDENPEVPGNFAIRGIPTLLLFKDGQLAETVVGLQSKEELAAMIERHL